MSKRTREWPQGARSISNALLVLLLLAAGCGRSRTSHGGPGISGADAGAPSANGGAQDVDEGASLAGASTAGGAGLVAGATSSGGAAGEPSDPARAVALSVTPSTASLISGEPLTVAVTATFSDGTSRDVTDQATFVADDVTVVSVQRNVVTGYIPGQTRVVVSALGLEASIAIEVRSDSILSLTVVAANIDCQASGYSAVFRASGVAGNGLVHDVTKRAKWTTATPSLLLFSDSAPGVALCLGSGMASVSATVDSVHGELTVDLRSPAVVGFRILSPGVARPDDPVLFDLQVDFDDFGSTSFFRYRNVERFAFVSSDPRVLSVDLSGSARALEVGTATVSGVLDGEILASTLLRVSDSPLVSIAIVPQALELAAPNRAPLSAIGTYLDGTTADITGSVHWSSPVVLAGDGWATPWNAGTGAVAATLENQRASGVAVVLPGTPTAIDWETALTTVPRFASIPLRVGARYAEAPNAQVVVTDVVSFTNSEPQVIAVSQTPALASGLSVGTSDLVAVLGTLHTDPATLTVSDAQAVAFHVGFDEAGLGVGDTLHIPAIVTFDDSQDYDVSPRTMFKSSNPSVATVSNSPGSRGDVTALSPGKTSITISFLTLSTTVPVEVYP